MIYKYQIMASITSHLPNVEYIYSNVRCQNNFSITISFSSKCNSLEINNEFMIDVSKSCVSNIQNLYLINVRIECYEPKFENHDNDVKLRNLSQNFKNIKCICIKQMTKDAFILLKGIMSAHANDAEEIDVTIIEQSPLSRANEKFKLINFIEDYYVCLSSFHATLETHEDVNLLHTMSKINHVNHHLDALNLYILFDRLPQAAIQNLLDVSSQQSVWEFKNVSAILIDGWKISQTDIKYILHKVNAVNNERRIKKLSQHPVLISIRGTMFLTLETTQMPNDQKQWTKTATQDLEDYLSIILDTIKETLNNKNTCNAEIDCFWNYSALPAEHKTNIRKLCENVCSKFDKQVYSTNRK